VDLAGGPVARGAAIVPMPMIAQAARGGAPVAPRHYGEALRIAFAGPPVWLDGCAPRDATYGMRPGRFTVANPEDLEPSLAAIAAFRPHVTVVLDPPAHPVDALRGLPGATLGVLVGALPDDPTSLEALDRVVCFDPSLTGAPVGAEELWRAIPPPVSDALFDEVRPLRHAPRAISIGSSSPHRETMLASAKHHHDLLQVIHGVHGEALQELLRECDVGVYVAPGPGGGFGLQVGVHLAAGQLLLAGDLNPSHGLERNIDYLHVDSPDGLAHVLQRLGRFPGMYQRIRVRGRLKAEQYRASRLFARLAGDLLADVAAFGSPRASPP